MLIQEAFLLCWLGAVVVPSVAGLKGLALPH